MFLHLFLILLPVTLRPFWGFNPTQAWLINSLNISRKQNSFMTFSWKALITTRKQHQTYKSTCFWKANLHNKCPGASLQFTPPTQWNNLLAHFGEKKCDREGCELWSSWSSKSRTKPEQLVSSVLKRFKSLAQRRCEKSENQPLFWVLWSAACLYY